MLRGLLAYLVLVPLTGVLGTAAIVISWLGAGHRVMHLARVWSGVMLRVCGARVEYRGLEHLRAAGPRLFVSNHQSNVDIWAIVAVVPLSTRFVAKQSLFRVPILGQTMRVTGFLSIDRRNREKAIATLRSAARAVRSGTSLVLFPEGTRSRDGVAPFKKGPFHLALEAGVPLVPITIDGSGRVMPPRSLRVRPGPVRVEVLPAIDVAPYAPADHDGLRRAVETLIRERLRNGADAGARGAPARPSASATPRGSTSRSGAS